MGRDIPFLDRSIRRAGPGRPLASDFLTGRNLPKIRQSREPEPSIINEKTIADFTRVVERLPRVAMSGS